MLSKNATSKKSTHPKSRPKRAARKHTPKTKFRPLQLYGKGDYSFSDLMGSIKNGVRDALSAGGAALGSSIAGGPGASLGRSLGSKLSRLIGTGDYMVAGDTAVNALIKAPSHSGDVGASFASNADIVRIRHREYINDITTGPVAGAFALQSLPVNPALVQSFPYLANIAQNFEEYRFRGLVFEFVSSASPYLASSAMGTLVVAMEYNPLAPVFTNKPQMENSDYAVSSRFDKNLMYGVECKQFTQNSYLTRYQAADPLTAYDSGLFQVATVPGSGFPVNSVVGELWVSYDVELMRPRVSPARFGLSHYFYGVVGSGGVYPVPVLRASYGTLSNVQYSPSSPNVITIVDAIQGDIYQITVSATGTETSAITITAATGIVPFAVLQNGTSGANVTLTPCTNPNTVYFGQVTATSGGNVSFTIGGAGLYTVDLIITDLGNGLVSSNV